MSETLVFTILIVVGLTSTFLVLLSFTLLLRYSLDEHHLQVKLFGIFRIRSIPYSQMVEVRVVPWWKEFSPGLLWAERWPSHVFARECVLITTHSMLPFVFLSPSAPAIFASTLSSRVANAVSCPPLIAGIGILESVTSFVTRKGRKGKEGTGRYRTNGTLQDIDTAKQFGETVAITSVMRNG